MIIFCDADRLPPPPVTAENPMVVGMAVGVDVMALVGGNTGTSTPSKMLGFIHRIRGGGVTTVP